MDFLFLILIIGLIFLGLKMVLMVLRAGMILLSIPLALAAVCIVTAVCVLVFPVTLLTGFLAFIAASPGFIMPLAPFILVGWGLFLLARRRPH